MDKCTDDRFVALVAGTLLSLLKESTAVCLDAFSQLLVPRLGDWGALYLNGTDGIPRLEAVCHVDPSMTNHVWEFDRRFLQVKELIGGPLRAVQTGLPELVKNVPALNGLKLFLAPLQAATIDALGLRSYMCLPLSVHGSAIGAVFLAIGQVERGSLTDADLELASRLCELASYAVASSASSNDLGKRFRDLVNGLDAIVWESDSSRAHYHFVSQRAEEIVGVSVETWLSTANVWTELLHPDDRQQVVSAYRTAVAKGRDLDFEYRMQSPDGRTIWIRDNFYVVKNTRNEVVSVRGVITDVTEQHNVAQALVESEQALKMSERRFLSLVDGLQAIFWVSNVERSIYDYVSPRTEETFGYPPKLWLDEKDTWRSLLHPEDRERVLAEYTSAAFQGSGRTLEYRMTNADGSTRWVKDLFFFAKNNNGVPVNAQGMLFDRTAAQATSESLKRSETMLRLFADSVRDYAILTLDNAGLITDWNAAAERITGYTREEALGKSLAILCTDDDLARDVVDLELARATSHGTTDDLRWHIRKDRTRFWAVGVVTVLRDGCGALAGYVKLLRDATEVKNLEEALRSAKEAAETASEAKSQFLASMSHEIRTPLGAMIGFSESLLDTNLTLKERTDYAATICRNGKKLVTLIDDILDLSKVEAGRLEVERHEFVLLDVVNEVVTLLNKTAEENGVHLRVSLSGQIPERICSDPTRLRQVLLNIVGNAVKFTERGEVLMVISLVPHTEGQPTCLKFLVSDTGRGIAPEHQSRLFQPFVQADVKIAKKFGGTGLGLVLSRRLARALGGDVTLVDSSPLKGSTFDIVIETGSLAGVEMVKLPEPSPSPTLSSPDANRAKDLALGGARVLVVDDAPDNRTLVSHILRRHGAEVETADDGDIAVEQAVKGSFDVVLMDMQMPRMDGYEATAALRRKGYEKPIIALTAHAMIEQKQRCLEVGCDDFLVKPIDQKLLLSVIARHIAVEHAKTKANRQAVLH